MSTQLYLKEYGYSSDGKLYEPSEETECIQSADINAEIKSDLLDSDFFEDFIIYEDETYSSSTTLKKIRDDKIGDALNFFSAKLMHLIESDKVIDLKTIQIEEEIVGIMYSLKVISESYLLLKLKRDKFSASHNAIVTME